MELASMRIRDIISAVRRFGEYLRPVLMVVIFAAITSSAVVGVVAWKSLSARQAVMARSEADIRNLAHSLAEHASNSVQAVDVAMSGIADSLRYRDPVAERFNLFLAGTVKAIPQLAEIDVLGPDGNWKYSSLEQTPTGNDADRPYFRYHRDNTDPSIRISEPLTSRTSGRSVIVLSRRLVNQSDEFSGVLVGNIEAEFFSHFTSNSISARMRGSP
jgi:hypothetical protein